jgi:hypothetical protein
MPRLKNIKHHFFMKKIYAFLLPCLLVITAFGQDKVINDPNAEKRNVGSFHAIKVSSGITLTLQQGNTEAVAVSADEREYRDRIKTEVVNGVLKIYFDNNNWKTWVKNRKLRAYVSFKNLDGLDGSSGSHTTIEGAIAGNKLDLDFSSGAQFDGDVKVTTLTVDQSSGSQVNVHGSAESLKVETSSGAVFHGYELVTDNCSADASSGGSIQVTVNKALTAGASSGGGIRYKGNGVITSISTGSGGSVKKNS